MAEEVVAIEAIPGATGDIIVLIPSFLILVVIIAVGYFVYKKIRRRR